MKNLESFGVREMDGKDLCTTEGGIFPIIIAVCAAASLALAAGYYGGKAYYYATHD